MICLDVISHARIGPRLNILIPRPDVESFLCGKILALMTLCGEAQTAATLFSRDDSQVADRVFHECVRSALCARPRAVAVTRLFGDRGIEACSFAEK
jgi:hypothetical protein